jgi:tetratricopeptide (TPR) repeat protein
MARARVVEGGRSQGAAWALLMLAAGCAHRPAPASRGKAQAVVGPEAMKGGAVALASWIAYVSRKSELYDQHPPPPANESGDDFLLELGAREAQSAFWAEQRHKGAAAWPELDRQVEIWRAGFLPELVLLVHGKPGWTVPPTSAASLRLAEFASRFEGSYHASSGAALKAPSGKLVPDVPGGDFPDPEDLPLLPTSCGLAAEGRQAAWKSWAALKPRLGGAPLAAGSTIGFGQQLLAARRDPANRGRAFTWVSERVAYLAFFDGFCAVEGHDWPVAIAVLAQAADLDPGHPEKRLELALALTSAGRNPEALAQVDRALAATDDPCAVALGWRRRGYILFETGDLPGARAAYQKSLSYEPDSAVAQDELTTIAATLEKKSGTGPYLPPPSTLLTTSCQDGKPVPVR